MNVRGGEGAARKVFRDLSAVLSFAARREIVDRNPCEKAAVRKTDNHKERYLTLDEVMRLWALTGCRREEIAALKWSDVDLEHGCLRLENSKTGKSVRPLGIAAIAIPESAERSEESDFVFPAEEGENHFQGYKTPWNRPVKKAEFIDVSPHTLRHTMGSTTISSGEAGCGSYKRADRGCSGRCRGRRH